MYVCFYSFDLQRSKAKFALVPRLCIKREAQHTQPTLKSLIGKSFFFYPKNALPPLVIDCLLSVVVVVVVVLLVDGKTA